MFGIFGRKSVGAPVLNNLDDIKKLIQAQGYQQAGEIIRKAAVDGNLTCQIFLSNLNMQALEKMPTKQVERDFEFYTKLAAEGGDPASQFNLAKCYIGKVDASAEYRSEEETDLIRKAKYWHRKAAAQGFKPSIQSLKNLECFPD